MRAAARQRCAEHVYVACMNAFNTANNRPRAHGAFMIGTVVVVSAVLARLGDRQGVSRPLYDIHDIHAYYINLEHDHQQNTLTRAQLEMVFGIGRVHRISGIKHDDGKEGCRLSHIKAHETALASGREYYIVSEDGGWFMHTPGESRQIVHGALVDRPDLVLYNVGQFIENSIELRATRNAHLYRMTGSGQSAVMYMVHRSFGKILVDTWKQRPGDHIDYSWQPLWKQYRVYLSKPLLVRHIDTESNVEDGGVREEIQAFDWDLWEKCDQWRKQRNTPITTPCKF